MSDDVQDTSDTPTVREHANLRLPHSDRAPRMARAFVAQHLREWQLDELIEPASLVVSEMVSNAVIHARSDAELVVERTTHAVRISVFDQGDGLSGRSKTPGIDGGRGLIIVEAIAAQWGTGPIEGGNRVWAELTIDPA